MGCNDPNVDPTSQTHCPLAAQGIAPSVLMAAIRRRSNADPSPKFIQEVLHLSKSATLKRLETGPPMACQVPYSIFKGSSNHEADSRRNMGILGNSFVKRASLYTDVPG